MANQSHAANMTQGSIWKLMVRFAIPIFLGNLFQQFYNVADTFIVGNVLGTEAMAAVGSSGNLIFMLIGFFQGVFVGAGVVVSRFWSQGIMRMFRLQCIRLLRLQSSQVSC